MTINSFFYDSLGGDRLYSSADFAAAFNVILKTGIVAQNDSGKLGFDMGGAEYRTIYAGTAVIKGRFIELTGIETLEVPDGSYSGMVALKVDSENNRRAEIVVKKDRTPIQTNDVYELPLYNIIVTNGAIGLPITDVRVQGGTISSDYSKTQLDAKLAKKVRFYETSGDGAYVLRLATKEFYGTSTANANVLVSVTDSEHAHNYLILVAHFQDGSYNNVTKLAGNVLTYATNTLGSIIISGNVGLPKIKVYDLGSGNYV